MEKPSMRPSLHPTPLSEQPAPMRTAHPSTEHPTSDQAGSKNRRWLRRLAYTAATLGLVLVVLPLILTAAFGDRVALAAVESLNKQLAVPVELEPDGVRFSLWRDFPDASLSFHGLRIPSSLPQSPGSTAAETADFVVLERLALRFSPLDLLRGRYRIRELRLEKGHVQGLRRADGTANFRFWKAPDSSAKGPLKLDLERLELRDVAVRWTDLQASTELRLDVTAASARGSMADGLLQAQLDSKGQWYQSRFNGRSLPLEGPFALSTELEDLVMDPMASPQARGTWHCPDYRLEFAGWTANGSATSNKEAIRLEGQANGRARAVLETLEPLLPQARAALLRDLDARGQVSLNGHLEWPINQAAGPAKAPDYRMALAWTDGRIRQNTWGLDLDRMSFRAQLDNAGGFRLAVDDFAARQAGAVLNLDLLMEGLGQSAELDLKADGNIEAASLGTLIALAGLPGPYGTWTDWRGRLRLDQVHIRGPWLSPKARQNGAAKASGQLALDGFSWKRGDARWTLQSGVLVLDHARTRVDAAVLNGPGTEARLDLEVVDFLPALLDRGPAQPSGRPALPRIKGRMDADRVDFAALLALLVPRPEQETNTDLGDPLPHRTMGASSTRTHAGDAAPVLHLPRLAGELDLHIRHFAHQELRLEDVESRWRLSPGYWKAEQLSLNGMEGWASGTASLRDRPQGGLLLHLEGQIRQVAVDEVFRQFNDFGQLTLTHAQLSGQLDGELDRFRGVWDSRGRFAEEEVVVQAEVRVRNGVLQDFEPVMALSRFVDIRDLERIEFLQLHNSIRIEERMVHLPAMDIRSNALNLRLSGSHGFDNQVDYAIQIGLLDLLSRKFRKRDRDQPFEERPKEGGLNLFVHMQGPASAPAMAFNQRETRDAFRDQADGLFEREREARIGRTPDRPMPDRGSGIPGAGSSSGQDLPSSTPHNTPDNTPPGPSESGAGSAGEWEFIDWEDNGDGGS